MILAASVGNDTGESVSAHLTMYDTTVATKRPNFHSVAQGVASNGNANHTIHSSQRLANQDTDALQILFSSGNITSGTWELYGFK
jgi:hypothetical protein